VGWINVNETSGEQIDLVLRKVASHTCKSIRKAGTGRTKIDGWLGFGTGFPESLKNLPQSDRGNVRVAGQ